MFIFGPTFSSNLILSARMNADFPIGLVKNLFPRHQKGWYNRFRADPRDGSQIKKLEILQSVSQIMKGAYRRFGSGGAN